MGTTQNFERCVLKMTFSKEPHLRMNHVASPTKYIGDLAKDPHGLSRPRRLYPAPTQRSVVISREEDSLHNHDYAPATWDEILYFSYY
ncbi:Protein of unknown function [Pyronema omphalodes CBS 100304]|uniref:Uncharacterized protein n=1 Tax=Pyronema omphalodes (strain CBS 100304) TaxID=1076935 RepID=U4LKU6_PYROM|nr:Protein of unknown function [Pyronema omphalodes CBS 100304]